MPSREALEAVIRERFLGDILQTPPMYSAVKQGGRPLYAIARSGGTAEIAARPAHIDACEVLSRADASSYRLRVECGSGTYIRTLFHDLGQALGCPAHMRMLIRTRSGCFSLEHSLTCEQLTAAAGEGRLADCLLPMDWTLGGYRRITLAPQLLPLARNGVPVSLDRADVREGETVAVYADGRFYGVGRGQDGEFRMGFLAEP